MKQKHYPHFSRITAVLILGFWAAGFLILPADAAQPVQSVRHILLIGRDAPEDAVCSRADCILLCSFQPENSTITMTSFLRDLYVEIPGYGFNRLNSAYAFGGASLLRQTLLKNFDIPIDGYVETDFTRFPQLVDLLGGVTLALRQDEAELLNSQNLGLPLQPGIQQLNGQQALSYARIRNLDADGDFSRTARQQALLKAMLQHFRNASVPKLLQVLSSICAVITTDIPKRHFSELLRQLAPRANQLCIHSQQIPVKDTYRYQSIDGMCVLVPDLQKNRQFLKSSLGS